MMADRVEGFIEGLISQTKNEKLKWQPFGLCKCKNSIYEELENGRGGFDYGLNSVRESASYFLESGEGYVFLFEIYHGDPDITSPEMDTVGLMIKVNPYLPLENLTNYTTDEQKQLEILKIIIENQLDEKYALPDAWYHFFDQVLGE